MVNGKWVQIDFGDFIYGFKRSLFIKIWMSIFSLIVQWFITMAGIFSTEYLNEHSHWFILHALLL